MRALFTVALLTVPVVAAALQAMVTDNATSIAQTGIIAAQVLLLWRLRRVEKEQSHQSRVSHWENDVLQQIAFHMRIKILPRPERKED